MSDPKICSINCGGIGNRLKSFWGARRQDPHAVLTWDRHKLWGSTITKADLEDFSDLFENQVCVSNSFGLKLWKEWRLYTTPEEGVIDYLYNDTPASAIAAYLPIVQEMIPTKRVLDLVENEASKWPGTMIGFHFRGKVDDPRLRYELQPYHVNTILSHTPCFVATDDWKLRRILNKEPGVFMSELDDSKLIRSDYTHAIVDMLLLSKCQELFVNLVATSTFAELAWWFGGAKQKVTDFDLAR